MINYYIFVNNIVNMLVFNTNNNILKNILKSKFGKYINVIKLVFLDKFCSLPILYLISFLNDIEAFYYL